MNQDEKHHSPSTERASRENAGVSDTPNAAPHHSPKDERTHDFTHRTEQKIQGEEIETTGSGSERRPEDTHI